MMLVIMYFCIALVIVLFIYVIGCNSIIDNDRKEKLNKEISITKEIMNNFYRNLDNKKNENIIKKDNYNRYKLLEKLNPITAKEWKKKLWNQKINKNKLPKLSDKINKRFLVLEIDRKK